MATTTTNFGFYIPQSSDLVKDGATAMATLGQDIDTFLFNSQRMSGGRNKIINGDFRINQRSFSSTTATGEFTFDRFRTGTVGGTSTFSAQTFTLGSAPVSGYEGTNFIRVASTGQSAAGDLTQLVQRIESVRTLAGQSVTVSFWAKASTGTPSIAADLLQYFGTGGSPSSAVSVAGQKIALTTSWARYSFTYTLASISGKTIGTNNNDSLWLRLWTSAGSTYNTETNTIGIQTATIDIWGVQVEAGSVATPFSTATGTLAGELAACQRYYEKSYDLATAPGTATSVGSVFSASTAGSVTVSFIGTSFEYKVTKRTIPTITLYDGAGNSGKVTRETIGGTGTNNSTAGTGNIGANRAVAFSSDASSDSAIKFHFTAEAEL